MGQSTKMFAGLSCRMLVGWFLMFWDVTFFFSAIWGCCDCPNTITIISFRGLKG